MAIELHLEKYPMISSVDEGVLYKGISDYAYQKKGLPPLQPFSIFIKDQQQNVKGGLSGVTFYGSLYIDSLWVDETIRNLKWGTKLMLEAENIGRSIGARFVTLNTMDWEGLIFYQKLGYAVEFIREGYEKNSKMFLLRKSI